MSIFPPILKLTPGNVEQASKEWGFNCGPAALCAILGRTPTEIRGYLKGFDKKRYTNPLMMREAINTLGFKINKVWECLGAETDDEVLQRGKEYMFLTRGLIRVQWGGPWTDPGVPARERYRHSHWIAVDKFPDIKTITSPWFKGPPHRHDLIVPIHLFFDINAIWCSRWLTWEEWADKLAPYIMDRFEPYHNGVWWPTHCWEVEDGG